MAFLSIYLSIKNVKRGPPTYRCLTFFMNQRTLVNALKILWAAHHYIFHSDEIEEIAGVINVAPKKLQKWMQHPDWQQALSFWGRHQKKGDLQLAERLWTQIFENGDSLLPVEYFDEPFEKKNT